MKIIDLSTTIEFDPAQEEGAMFNPRIEFTPHETGLKYMEMTSFPGVKPEQIPNGGFNAFDIVGPICTHCGTHFDAPLHYNKKMNGDEDAWAIDEIPVEWFYGDGVVFDFSDKPGTYSIQPEDLQEQLDKMGYELKPGDIVFIHTAAPKYAGTYEYQTQGAGMSRAATLWLTKEKGIRVTGTDSYGWDRPFPVMGKEWVETGDPSVIWEGHLAGVEQAYSHIEKLWNLDKLPSHGFKVVCAPIKLKGCTAGWVRPIAIIED